MSYKLILPLVQIIKSSVEHTAALEKEVKALHPYDTPQFVGLPVSILEYREAHMQTSTDRLIFC